LMKITADRRKRQIWQLRPSTQRLPSHSNARNDRVSIILIRQLASPKLKE
jgi:hypothetical protein